MRGRPAENVTKKMKYTLEFEDSIWYFDLNKLFLQKNLIS